MNGIGFIENMRISIPQHRDDQEKNARKSKKFLSMSYHVKIAWTDTNALLLNLEFARA